MKWEPTPRFKPMPLCASGHGIYSQVRMDDKLCLLVIVSDDTGRKELLAVSDGYGESEASLLQQLQTQGLKLPPTLAIGDGALGFWKALTKCWPQTKQQRCWFHKTGNILNKVPKSVQPKIKEEALRDVWMAESRSAAEKAVKSRCFQAKYPKATECLLKDEERLLAFYDLPAESIYGQRTRSMFVTVRLKVKHCGSRTDMVFKLAEAAQRK